MAAIAEKTGTMEIEQINLYRPTATDLKNAWYMLRGDDDEYNQKRYLVRYSKPTTVQIDNRHRKEVTEIVVKFFESKNGIFAYTLHKRTGYDVSYLGHTNIESIEVAGEKKQKKTEEEQIQSLLNRRHPNAWTHLTVENVKGLELGVVNIKSKFPSYVIDALVEAFENKTPYHYRTYGKRRDLSVETKLSEDGVFRAWFSSEYAGCANGAYYLLLNPTTATFREDD